MEVHLSKLVMVTVFMVMILILSGMREKFAESLLKLFRKSLWSIIIDSTMFFGTILLGIALYYNNFFDEWLYLGDDVSIQVRSGIRSMIEMH